MKKWILSAVCSLVVLAGFAQQALPAKDYSTLRDSITSIDVTIYRGGSLSMDGKSVKSFVSFFENKTTAKTGSTAEGMIMWQINGREFLSGKLFLGDSTGYVVVVKDNKEYVNVINPQGNKFFKDRIKK